MKFRRLFLLFLLIICLAPAKSTAIAQAGATLSISPGQSNVALTGTTQINLAVAAGLKIMAFDVTIEYDASKVSLVEWVHGDYLSNLSVVYKVETPGLFHLACTQLATAPVSGDGNLLTFSFQGISLGMSAITISQAEFYDGLGDPSNPQIIDGVLTVITGPIVVPTATLTQMATPTSTPTATRTFTPSPSATPMATASRTFTPATSPTATQQSSTFPVATATRQVFLTNTPQSRLTATPIVQQPTLTAGTDTQNPFVASPTTELTPVMGQLVTDGAGRTTDPIFIPVRPEGSSTSELAEEQYSSNGKSLGIILFALIAMAAIMYFVWRRRHNDVQRKQ